MNPSFIKLCLITACVMGSVCACSDDKDIDTESQCTTSVCKDDNTLNACDTATGVSHETPCAFGCDRQLNQCRTTPIANKCTANVCKDDRFISICDPATGDSQVMPCEYGCDKKTNQCKENKCTANKCKDASILYVCNPTSGEYVETTCDDGCKDDACVHKASCVPLCESDDQAIVCHEDGSSEKVKCPIGCDKAKGVCRSDSIVGESCKTEAAPKCEGNDLIYCAETTGKAVWTRLSCPQNYECKTYEDQALCLETCTKSGETGTICGSGFLVGSECKKLDDKMYYLPDYEQGILKSCEVGCQDAHVCMETTCDESFVERCVGDKGFYYCEDGYVSSGICSDDKSCYISSNKKAKCGYTCDPEKALSKRCYYQFPDEPDSGESAYTDVICQKGDTGYGYEPGDYKKCPGKCSDSAGCL